MNKTEPENGVFPPMMHLTCYDGTQLHIPDDNKAIYELGDEWNRIYANSSLLSRKARKYIIYRPPFLKRFITRAKQIVREIWN